jgi:O-antigen/teichoic acid export membrane protein
MSFIKTAVSFFKNVHFQSLLGNGVMAVFNMITWGILFRALSVYDLGVYAFFMVIYNLVDTVKTGFLTNAFVIFYSGATREKANEVAGSAWTLGIIISLGLIILNIPAYFIASGIKDAGTALYLKYFSIAALSTLPLFMATLVVQAEMRFDRLFWARLINQLLYIGGIVILMVLKKATLSSVLIAFTATNFMASFIIMLFGWSRLGTIRNTTKKMCLQIYHFGKYSVGTNISSNLFKVTDTFFINTYLGAQAVAIYSLGIRWMPIVEIPMYSFTASNMPLLADYYKKGMKDEMLYLMKKMVGMLSMAFFVVVILAIIFAEPLILMVGGDKYLGSEAPNLFRILICIAFLFPTDRFFALSLDVIEKPRINFYKILIMLAVNLGADYFGLKIYDSVFTIAITNVLPVLVSIMIVYVPLKKYYKFNFWDIYVTGYKESILLLKHTYRTLFIKEKAAGN